MFWATGNFDNRNSMKAVDHIVQEDRRLSVRMIYETINIGKYTVGIMKITT